MEVRSDFSTSLDSSSSLIFCFTSMVCLGVSDTDFKQWHKESLCISNLDGLPGQFRLKQFFGIVNSQLYLTTHGWLFALCPSDSQILLRKEIFSCCLKYLHVAAFLQEGRGLFVHHKTIGNITNMIKSEWVYVSVISEIPAVHHKPLRNTTFILCPMDII